MLLYMLSKPKLYQIFTLMIRKPQKEAATGQFMVHLFFSLQEQILPTYDIIRPSIHLSSTNLFLFALFLFFLEGGGEGKVPYLICLTLANFPFLSNAITLPSPPPYPYEMMQG